MRCGIRQSQLVCCLVLCVQASAGAGWRGQVQRCLGSSPRAALACSRQPCTARWSRICSVPCAAHGHVLTCWAAVCAWVHRWRRRCAPPSAGSRQPDHGVRHPAGGALCCGCNHLHTRLQVSSRAVRRGSREPNMWSVQCGTATAIAVGSRGRLLAVQTVCSSTCRMPHGRGVQRVTSQHL
jgi:hypothetical protein